MDTDIPSETPKAPAEESAPEEPKASQDEQPVAPQPESPDESPQDQLEKLHQERDELQQKLLRKAADYENYRKRTMKEREDLRAETEAYLIEDLLPAIDTLKLGLQAAENHDGAADITQGFALVLEQFRNILSQRGLVETDPVGEAFDPKLHDGVSQIASDDVAEGNIVETIRIGYYFKERLLRPATVVVSTGPSSSEEEAPASAED